MTRQTITELDQLWQAWDAMLPRWSPQEQRAGIVLLRELASGQSVGADRLAEALGAPLAEVDTLLKESELSPFVYRGDDGRVVGFWGLSTVPMHHRFSIRGRKLWTWCAEDSLFLPELIDATARIESRDPQSDLLVHLTISPTAVEAVEPEGVAVSVLRPDTVDFTSAARVIATTCHFIFFFASRASGERWVDQHPGTVLLSLDEAFAFAKRLNARLYGKELMRP